MTSGPLAPAGPVDRVREVTADVLGIDVRDVHPDRPWRTLGVTGSLVAALLDRLAALGGRPLPVTLLFEHPTPAAVAGYLAGDPAGGTPVAEAGGPAGDPVVVVGMACRFPGDVDSPDALWRLVDGEVDAVTPFPADRGWDVEALYDPALASPGTSCTRHGGFLAGGGDFDADFFGIGPREALAMDPQQRIALEMSWEVLENAGIRPASLHGSRTGVFLGCYNQEYGPKLGRGSAAIEGYRVAGSYTSVASGRIAYSFGFTGPALTVDTACSSSLVALHLAERSLRQGECSLALAGGVMLMATPGPFVEFSRQRGLSPDGRCRAFAEAADGTGWSEGAGLVLLERLSDARRHGHRVLAVIRGSAVNQDGASNGLTAPSGVAQQRVIRQALANAGLGPSDVDVVEAHGTGTRLGDPIEANALLAAYTRPADDPLWLGSLKSNIGHTQAAAGVGGVIKMVLAMRHGRMPRTLHVDRPTPHVDWAAGGLALLTDGRDWERTADRPRRAAVSSFGISGTNAHLVLEEGDPVAETSPQPEAPAPWVLSARTSRALTAQADRLAAWADRHPEVPAADVGRSLAGTRSVFGHRAVVVGRDARETRAALGKLAAGAETAHVVAGVAGTPGRTVFVFPGQGHQWLGMGAELSAASPVFARRLAECDAALAPFTGWSVADVVRGTAETSWDKDESVLQPALFAMTVSLAALWRSHGIEPDVVLGHSQGEIAAACVAGALSLGDAARVVALRSGIIARRLTGRGGMVTVAAPADRVRAMVADAGPEVQIGAFNGPSWCVVSGGGAGLAVITRRCAEAGITTRRVPISYPSHSPAADAVHDELLAALRDVEPSSGEVPFHSTVTNGVLDGTELGAGYWYRNLREPVRFGPAVEELLTTGATTFVEVSAHPVLAVGLHEAVEAHGGGIVVGTLQRNHGGLPDFWTSAARLHVRGVDVDWTAAFDPAGSAAPDLPAYAFDRRRYWAPDTEPETAPDTGALGHPLLGTAVDLADGGLLCTGRITPAHAWLRDHVVLDTPLLPGAALLDLALCAAARAGADGLREFVVERPLPLPEDGGTDLQVLVGPAGDGTGRPVAVHARRTGSGDEWTRHGTGVLSAPEPAVPAGDDVPWPPAGAVPVDLTGVYDRLRARGFGYGPAFAGLLAMWHVGAEVCAEVGVPADAPGSGFAVHPVLLDAALHAVLAESALRGDGETRLPFGFGDVVAGPAAPDRARVRFSVSGSGSVALRLTDASGTPVVTIGELVLRPATAGRVRGGEPGLTRVGWEPLGPVAGLGGAPVPSFCVVSPQTGDHDVTTAARAELNRVLALVQQRIRHPGATQGPLVVVTRGATGPAGTGDPVGAAVWGLVRSAQVEHPGSFVLADIDGDLSERVLSGLAASGEAQLAVRDGVAFVPRLHRVPTEPTEPTEPTGPAGFHGAGGTWLLTGGTGLLAGVIARHLVTTRAADRVVLVSRRGRRAPGADGLAGELTGLGAAVDVVACDVADAAAVRALVESLGSALRGVVHAAGVLDDGVVEALTPQRLDRVLRAKADGAWHLHRATAHLGLDAFVLCSSVTGVLGSGGQASYTAANAFLDGLAGLRHGLGLPATSIAWGLWAEASGITGHLGAAELSRLARSGVGALANDEGARLFAAACGSGLPAVTGAKFDLAAAASGGEVSPLLGGLLRPRAKAPARRPEPVVPLGGEDLLDVVLRHAGVVLGHDDPGTRIDEARAFKDLGFDSLGAMELRNRLAAATGLRLTATVVFEHPTPAALAAHLRTELDLRQDHGAELLSQFGLLKSRYAGLPEQSPARAALVTELTAFLASVRPTAAVDDLSAASDEDLMALIDSIDGAA